jgi:putative transposase
MMRSFELRLCPSKVQIEAFNAILADSCETYNAALQERKEAWKLQTKNISYYDQCSELTELRKEKGFARIAVEIQRESLRRIDRAFKAFFRRCKSGRNPGFPRYRSLGSYDSFAFSNRNLGISAEGVKVPNLGWVKFKTHRKITGILRHVTVKRLGAKWIGRIICDIGNAPPKQTVSNPVGIDLGLATFATLSDGTEIKNPRFIQKHAQCIARVKQNLARKLRGSKNRLRAKEQVRRSYQRMTDARKNFCHHVSKQLVSKYDLIAHEDLKISEMVRNKDFAKSIMDAAWGILLFQLAYKAESAGRYVVAVNPRNTSQMCSGCGVIVKKTLSQRQHICECGTVLGRDHNAARNILALGRSVAGLTTTKEIL